MRETEGVGAELPCPAYLPTSTYLRRYAFEVFGSSLKSPTFVLGADANHDDLTATLTELATVLDHDTTSLAASNAHDDLVAYLQRV